MPRLTRIRLRALDDLARQLRFTPGQAALRQVRAALAMAREVDPARVYPEDWVIRRITGFRADVPDPAQLVGEALLADVSAFVERISNQSRLTEEDFAAPCLGLAELGRRWSVSARSIERYRRRGLIGLRLRRKAGGVRLVFPADQVERFEQNHSELLETAASFTRISPSTRLAIIEAAAVSRAATGASVSRLASAIAGKFGISRETVRRLLLEHDASAAAPVFRDRFPLDDAARRSAFEAWRAGEGPTITARRLNVSRSAIHRHVNLERANLLKRLDLTTPFPDRFERPDAAETFLSDPQVRMGLGAPGDTDAGTLASAARASPAPEHRRERLLAGAHHYLCWRAAGAIRRLRHPLGPRVLDRIETDLRWAALLRVELIRGQRGLIVRSIEERLQAPLLDLAPTDLRRWIAAAFDSAAMSIARFDPFGQGRFAVPLSLALAKALSGLKPIPQGSTVRAHPVNLPVDDWAARAAPWQAWLSPPDALRAAISERRLAAADESLLRRRFGIGIGPPATLEELRQEQESSPARLRRLIRSLSRENPK